MKKTALLLIILTIITKVIGFGREITLSYFYGASNISDAYLISKTIPTTIFAFVGTGIATSYIPMYSSIVKEKGNMYADKFTSNIINISIIICTVIILLCLVFTLPIVKLFASGLKGETLNLAVKFTRISVLGICFSALTYVFSGYLNLKNNFVIPALMSIPFNFVLIMSIVFSVRFGTLTLPLGTVVAMIVQMAFLIPFVSKSGYYHRLILDRSDKDLKKMIHLSLPVIIGVSVNQINVLVDRTIASRIAVGGISALTYANRLNLFIQGIFVVSVITAMYPIITKMAGENNYIRLKKTISEAINVINLLVIPATIGSMFFAEPIVKLLFGRGAFNSQALFMTSYALFFYSIGMVGFGLREVLSRAFYSLQDTRTPVINAAIAMVLNIVLNFILSKFLGVGGLALATSISAFFATFLMFISLRKKIGSLGMRNIGSSFLKILCSSLVMGLIAKASFNYLTTNIFSQNLSLILSIGIGSIAYLCIIYFMNIEDVNIILHAIRRKMKKDTV